ncbi:hypothetical protein [Acetobacter conturbans]|uniref:Uncharacterized protein n=1 Tax=Acetobacter conturbans TaxID=1737472 RepID=A0ABX0JYU3_9PROT|nr:hypothetical protein [Acetobacter conturbans]NHN87711.1 hypothetical protein [Acetobacter conturbans]
MIPLFRIVSLAAAFWVCALPLPALSAETAAPPATPAASPVGTILLGRPLFEPDRRPKGVPVAEQGGFRLAGIAGRSDHWVAIFRNNAPDAKSEIRQSGQMIQDWTIATISRTAVKLTRNSETRDLKPTFLFDHSRVPDIKPDTTPQIRLLATKHTDPHLAW